jgi:hypothetical protein
MHKFAGLLTTIICLAACGPGTPVALTIQSPSATAYTKGTVDVQVSVSSDPQGSVVLLKNGVLLTTLSAPYKYAWDTAPEPEGQYVLTARIRPTNQGFDSPTDIVSPPRTVIVDRTPPTVVNRSPAPGSSNVRLEDPVSLTFSEAINPTSVTDASVNLLSSGSSTPKTLTLSSDGRTVTIKPTQALDPGNPVTYSVTPSSAITDLAGNALVIPADAWGWTLPVWWTVGGGTLNQDLSNNSDNPQIVLDAKGHPVVAWSELGKVLVKRWTGSSWALIGSGGLNTGGIVSRVYLALDSGGNPALAWSEYASGSYDGRVFVTRWNGSSWQTVGNQAINLDQNKEATDPALSLDSSGNPFVAWVENVNDPSTPVKNVFVKRWTGASWVLVGPGTVNQNVMKAAYTPALALDSSGNPVVAWSESIGTDPIPPKNLIVKHWNGSTWALIGTGAINNDLSGYATDPSLAIDRNDNPVVAYTELPAVFVKRWTGASWALVGPGTIDQDATRSGLNPSLVLDPSGNPVVAWDESGFRKSPLTYLKRWTGASWALVGADTISRDTNSVSVNPSVVLDSSGKPFVALLESTGRNAPIFVKRFNR